MKQYIRTGLQTDRYGRLIPLLGILALALLQGCEGSDDKGGSSSRSTFVTAEVKACMSEDGKWVDDKIDGRSVDMFSGARSYDKWWAELGQPEPTDDHPLWETRDTDGADTNNRSGADTWRCKECHGWDYMGKDGLYAKGSHYTGFAGIFDAQKYSPKQVFCSIKAGKDHDFGEFLTDREILDITAFITDSEVGMQDYYVMLEDLQSTGDAAGGATLYDNSGCSGSQCHGSDGKGQAEWLGDLSNENPPEFAHKVLYGHPGTFDMPAFGDVADFLVTDEVADVLAFAQQELPQSQSTGGTPVSGDALRGGLLYDNWASVYALENGPSFVPPTTTNPLYIRTSGTQTGASTWRCKECHGWDYKGKDGQYGISGGSHYSGVSGIFAARDKDAADLTTIIQDGAVFSGESLHNFGAFLAPKDIAALVAFIKTALVDTDDFIMPSVGIGRGDALVGAPLYNPSASNRTTCGSTTCHGMDGKNLMFNGGLVSLGNLARNNPWEVLHKMRFGQPDQPSMIPTLETGYSDAENAGILAHTQTLPD